MNKSIVQCEKCGWYIFTTDKCCKCEEALKMGYKILLKDRTTGKVFEKTFDTEFERDNFIRRLRYSKKLMLVSDYSNNMLD